MTRDQLLAALATCPWLDRISVVICGMAPGADLLGRAWALERGLPVIPMPADWLNMDLPICVPRQRWDGSWYNAGAGIVRNQEMARVAEALVAVRVNGSPGTTSMISEARKHNLLIHAVDLKVPGMRYQGKAKRVKV